MTRYAKEKEKEEEEEERRKKRMKGKGRRRRGRNRRRRRDNYYHTYRETNSQADAGQRIILAFHSQTAAPLGKLFPC